MEQSTTEQLKMWGGEFGEEYTERNKATVKEMDALYQKKYGITRRRMNGEFLSDLAKDIRILEVGCNIGNQLALLKEMGFENLSGR